MIPEAGKDTFYVFWMGCGYGEEVLCVAYLAELYQVNINFICIDNCDNCIKVLEAKISELNFNDSISAHHADMLSLSAHNVTENNTELSSLIAKCHVFYTSASLGNVCSWKFIEQAIHSKQGQYLFCNDDVSKSITSGLGNGFSLQKLNRKLFCRGNLCTDGKQSGPKKRDIYFVEIRFDCEYHHLKIII